MKKSVMLLALVMAVVLISACFASTTLAKYSSTLTSQEKSALVAKWIDEDSATVTIDDLFSNVYYSTDGTYALASSNGTIIAPGTSGSSAVTITLGDNYPEVAYNVILDEVAVTQSSALTNLVWCVTTGTSAPSDSTYKSLVDGKIQLGSTPISVVGDAGCAPDSMTITIWWKWKWSDTIFENAFAGEDVKATAKITVVQTQ